MIKITLVFTLLITAVCMAEDFTVETLDRAFQVTDRPRLSVKNVDGSTIFRTGSGSEITVHAVKEVRYAKNEEEAKRIGAKVSIRMIQTGSTIEIAADYPSGFNGIHFGQRPHVMIHFEITSPPGTDVDSRSADGRTEISGYQGDLQIRSADGDIIANNLAGNLRLAAADGDIQAEGCNGQIEISVADGDVDARAISGTIRLRSADGKLSLTEGQGTVEARAADGFVSIDGIFQAVQASTADGKLYVTARPGSTVASSWALKTSDGILKLQLPESIQANLELRSGDGRINTDLPITITGSISRNRLAGKMNGGGSVILVQTADGSISISPTID